MRMLCLGMGLAFAAVAGSALTAQQAQPAPQQPRTKGIRLEQLAWPEAERALRPETVIVVPVGAAAKEHGPHLQLRNDLTMADYLTGRVLETADIVAAPTLTYHFYPAFLEYPGSTSLTADTARLLTVEVVRSLAGYGPKRFYALNTGISTLRPLEAAAKTLAAEGILLGFTNLEARLEPVSARLRQQTGGSHADEIETSMMLYIDPSSVDMRLAVKDYRPSSGALALTRRPEGRGTYSPSGIWGDPTLATRAKGQVLVEALVGGVLDDIEAVRRAPLPLAQGSAVPAAASNTGGPSSLPSGPRSCTPGDDRSIRQIGDAYTLAWSNADAQTLASLWTEEGDMFHPDGTIERTRRVILTNRAAMFSRREYRGSKHPLALTMIRCLNADVAVADGKWEMKNVTDAAGRILPPFEGQVTLVVQRAEGRWKIEAYRFTLKPAAVAPPAFLKRPGWPGGPGG